MEIEFFQKLAEQGILALILVLLALGVFLPKVVVERIIAGYEKQVEARDLIIARQDAEIARQGKINERQAGVIERLAEKAGK